MKDTIYVDIDDEITTIIDKVRSSDNKIVALVLPKRAAVLQSIVNMRLLKRTADSSKKKLVLITTEAGILPLAGMVGLHVARNLQSKPEVPTAPDLNASKIMPTIAEGGAADEPVVDANKSVGELSGIPDSAPVAPAVGTAAAEAAEAAPIEIDAAQDAAAAAAADEPIEIKAEKHNKKLAVPNFNKFRVAFFLAILGVVALIVGLVFATMVLPKARVSVKAEISTIPVTRSFNISSTAKSFDLKNGIVPSVAKTSQKADQEKFTATGEVDKGTKASGAVTLYNCNKEDKLADRTVTVPAGTGVSAGDITFITSKDVNVEPSSFVGNSCQDNKSADVDVVAQNAGDKYNVSARKYTVAGYPSMIATGTAMAGGVSKIAKVVSQHDFDTAKQKLLAHTSDTVKDDLKKLLQADGLTPLPETFTAAPGTVTSTPAVNEEAAEATASTTVTYTMQGVNTDDLKALITDSIKGKYDPSKEKLYKDGVGGMTLKLGEKTPKGVQPVILTTDVSSGPKLDDAAIKQAIVGKKRGDAKHIIEARPGVKEATVTYSPFWVTKAPKKLNRITVTFEVPANDKK